MPNSNKQTIVPPNLQRRRLMQGTVLAGAALSVPAMASAACNYGDHKLVLSKDADDSNIMLTNNDVTIELVETKTLLSSGKLARVTVTNTSRGKIKLSDISPEAVATENGVYKLNTTLAKNPLAIRSGGTYQFWLSADNSEQAMLAGELNAVTRQYAKASLIQVAVIT